MGIFRFKKFDVRHGKSAMKVGTDGVLLGAWADITNCKHILDIGAGTGLVALMLAQRNQQAIIDAVEIDSEAFEEMKENFSQAPWKERLQAIHQRIQDFETPKKYDLIVSNPPFFTAGTQSPDKQRHRVRHSLSLSHKDLIEGLVTLMDEKGKACMILPTVEGTQFIKQAKTYNIYLSKKTNFVSKPGNKSERLLLEFKKTRTEILESTLLHYDEKGEWSPDYKTLTRDFYLKL